MTRGTFRLAWRNLGRNRRRTAVVVLAVVIGISGSVFSVALNAGLVYQMVETAIATELGHLQIHAAGREDPDTLDRLLPDGGRAAAEVLAEIPAVRAWAPRLRSEGLVFSPRASVGARLLGIDPGREASVSRVLGSMVAGEALDGARRRILLGEVLARRLQVSVGAKVVVSVQDAGGELTGEAFRVGGVFRTPSTEFDGSTALVRLDEAQRLLGVGSGISEVVVLARDRSRVAAIRDALASRLGIRVEVETWSEIAPLLEYMVEFFDETAWMVYVAIFVAMAFGIANVLLMSVYERRREIGILMAVGMRPRRVVALVVTEAMLLTLCGVLLGFALAGLGAFACRDGIDLSLFAEGLGAYGIGSRVVPVIRSYDLIVPSAVAVVTAGLASLWPSLQVVRARPAEALRGV